MAQNRNEENLFKVLEGSRKEVFFKEHYVGFKNNRKESEGEISFVRVLEHIACVNLVPSATIWFSIESKVSKKVKSHENEIKIFSWST